MIITSKENDTIKYIKKLYDKKYRDIENKYIIEGVKIVKEAYISKQNLYKIFLCEELLSKELIFKYNIQEILELNLDKIVYVSESIFKSICDTKTPQGILAVIYKKENKEEILSNNILFLDRVQDCGNIGTILRSASALGFNDIILNKECGDVYNSKVLRATMGNIFKINVHILSNNGVQKLKELKNNGYKVYASVLENSDSIYNVDFNEKKVIVVGNEANGISKEIELLSDLNVIIPMDNNTESINVAIATAIILSEIKRRNY